MKNLSRIFWNWTVRKGIFALLIIAGALTCVNAQMSGSRGGVNQNEYGNNPQQEPPTYSSRDQVVEYIKVQAQVELRVAPDQIRVVLAISDNAQTAAECESKVFGTVDQLRAALRELEIPETDIVDDFIAVLPRYKFQVESQEGENILVEKLLDYSMQSNLHIKVGSDSQAMDVIRAAFNLGVTDVIGFDYWSNEINGKKDEALRLAIEQATAKSDLLLGATFEQAPEPVNIKSHTRVVMPDKLYESFENSHDQSVNQTYNYNKDNLPVIRAIRPKNTYYRGYMNEFGDLQPANVPMSCEISIVADVTMYYASPVARDYRAMESDDK